MKPSDRLKEIIREDVSKGIAEPVDEEDVNAAAICALIQYLDEEWLKKHGHPDGLVCKDCK